MLVLRAYQPSDAAALLALYRSTIREVNSADYDPLQIAAWASEDIDIQSWSDRFNDRIAYVAMLDDVVVGFADMTSEGYLDRLFVSARHQRQGIARALLSRLKQMAVETGIAQITTDSSITARPFFEAHGLRVLCEQTVACRGAEFINFRMVFDVNDRAA